MKILPPSPFRQEQCDVAADIPGVIGQEFDIVAATEADPGMLPVTCTPLLPAPNPPRYRLALLPGSIFKNLPSTTRAFSGTASPSGGRTSLRTPPSASIHDALLSDIDSASAAPAKPRQESVGMTTSDRLPSAGGFTRWPYP
jgi:hypothetical protein